MSTIYQFLATHKGASYKESSIVEHSWLRRKPKISKQPNEISGNSRVHGDITVENQALVIDLLIEIGARYKLDYREIAYLLLIVRVESGFNPDAAAGTTSAAGLGQYTNATVDESKKPIYSKHYLGFDLDLSGEMVFDAQRGAYGALLSYFICKKRTQKFFPNDWESNVYLFHHEGWYFNPTGKEDQDRVKKVRDIIKREILARLDQTERLLKQKSEIQVSLKTSDGKAYVNQPFVMVVPSSSNSKNPASVQQQAGVKVITGFTDGEGKTPKFSVPGLSEVVFTILNSDYRKILQNFPGRGTGKITQHKIKSGDTLGSIAKKHHTTPEALANKNGIGDVNRIKVGQVLHIPNPADETGPSYWWRRPELTWLSSVIAPHIGAEGLEDTSAVIEHKRSHVSLPMGNKAHGADVTHSNIVIAGGKTHAEVAAKKTTQKIPHQTNESQNAKPVTLQTRAKETKKVISGLLYPLAIKATADYHDGARRFGSRRAKGRKHAGIDLYAPAGTVVRAMSDGKVINVYAFYCGTWAIEIDHGSFIARYGEIDPDQNKIFVDKGDTVKRGEQIAVVGVLIGIKVPSNMLHLELYASTSHASLTEKGSPPYQRRNDLFDPTPSIDKASMQ